MKGYLSGCIFLFGVIMCLLLSKQSLAQDKDVKSIIDSKNYAFRVTHESGGDFALGNYYFYLINDSVSVALPYHGHSGAAAYTMDDNGINTHTKDFTYQCRAAKNGAFTIKINLNNDRLTRSFSIRVNKKGNAVLTVDSINRDAVSFNGVVDGL